MPNVGVRKQTGRAWRLCVRVAGFRPVANRTFRRDEGDRVNKRIGAMVRALLGASSNDQRAINAREERESATIH